MKKTIAIILIPILVACGGTPPEPENASKPIYSSIYGEVRRFHDDEKKVTCWIYEGTYKAGISCIPDAQLKD